MTQGEKYWRDKWKEAVDKIAYLQDMVEKLVFRLAKKRKKKK